MLQSIREIKNITFREVIHLLRDRHTLIYSVAIPIFLYPALLFGLLQAMAIAAGWKENQEARVLLAGSPPDLRLARLLERERGIRLVKEGETPEPSREAISRRIRSREFDAALTIRGGSTPAERLVVELYHSSARDASRVARERIEKVLESRRSEVILEAAEDIGEGREFLEVLDVRREDVATGERKANAILALILPLLMVVIIVMGAFYPALEVTAGERERQTLETTLMSPVPRLSLVIGKYLAVIGLAILAFLLNLASMTFSLKHLLYQLKLDALHIPPASFAVILAAAILLAGLFSAFLVTVGFLARTFKEGQSYMAPVYAVAILPVAISLSPDIELNGPLAAAPVVNITLVFREALLGKFNWPLIAIVLSSSALYTAAALALAAWLTSREGFLLGEGSLGWSRRLGIRRREP